jgi:tetratricopeptide (TPR) repeat protein
VTDLDALARAVLARPGDLGLRAAYAIACAEAAPGSARAESALREAREVLGRAAAVPALHASVDAAAATLIAAPALARVSDELRLVQAQALVQRAQTRPEDVESAKAAVALVAPLAERAWPAPWQAAEVALAAGDAATALSWLDRCEAAHQDPDALVSVARALLQLGDATTAARRCVQGLEAWPEHLELRLVTGAASLLRGDGDEALTHLAWARRLAPTRPDVLLNLVAAHGLTGSFAAALGVLDGLSDLHGPSAEPPGLREALFAGLAQALEQPAA